MMNTASSYRQTVFHRLEKPFESILLFGTLALAILLSVRPWRFFFFTGLGEHWDPKVMGHWMAWNAQHILQGSILFPHYNADYFYPHLYTLAFGEMLWPESFVYAALWATSHNRFLAFNGTMLFFWSLAGVAMYALLRELNISRAVGYLGSFIYCLMPFMMAFYIEFNMILVFVIPLILLLFIRWLDKPSIKRALWFCLGFYVSVTSCIYYTYMVAFPLACVFVIHVVNHRSLLKNKRFYLSTGVIVAGVVAIAAAYLYPYVILRLEGGYVRGLKDFQISHAQALHYLDTRSAYLIYSLFDPPTRWSETYLFPGSVLALLTLISIGANAARLPWIRNEEGWSAVAIAAAKFALWTLFWAVIIANAFFRGAHGFYVLLLPVSLALLALYGLRILLPAPACAARESLLITALAAGAVICFFISLGPVITVRHDAQLVKLGYGPMAALFTSTPIFGLVRGLTRFAIIPLTYLLIAGCFTLNQLIRIEKRLILVLPVLLAMIVYESSHMKYRYEDYVSLVDSPVMQRARRLPEKSVLFQIPTSPKVINNNIIMNTIGDFHFTVNGISGFVPQLFTELEALMKDWNVVEVTRKLSEVWPRVFLIIDRPATRWLAKGWHKPFPWETVGEHWKLVARDLNYSLYEPRQKLFTDNRIVRQVRPDVLKKNLLFTFSAHMVEARMETPMGFRVLINGHEAARGQLRSDWQDFRIQLPQRFMGKLSGDRVVLELMKREEPVESLPDDRWWEVRNMDFKAPVPAAEK